MKKNDFSCENHILQEILRQKDSVVFSNNFLTNGRKKSFCVNHGVSTLAEIDLLVTQTELLSEISASYHEMECHSAIRVSLRTKRSGVRVVVTRRTSSKSPQIQLSSRLNRVTHPPFNHRCSRKLQPYRTLYSQTIL